LISDIEPRYGVDFLSRGALRKTVLVKFNLDRMDRIPFDLLEGEPRTIGDMEVGETAWSVTIDGLTVDAEGRCWLKPTAALVPKSNSSSMWFQIRRENDGYHIVIPRQKYRPGIMTRAASELAVSVTFREGD
jgi:hypothetical protein